MQDKPDSNQSSAQTGPPPAPPPSPPPSVGGDSIVITGNVGPGATIGPGTTTNTQVAGGDLIINNGSVTDGSAQFTDLLEELKNMILQAQEKGELDAVLAKEAVEHLNSAADMVKKNKKPEKPVLLKKLQSVAEMIQAAVEMFTADDGGIATILLKALPIAALLIRLAMRLF